MSDFLKSLVARQLGEAPSVRPRLAGRFEPPPDAFAHEAARRAAGFDEPDSDALELSLEVETRPAHAREAATQHDRHEDARTREPRRETDETHARVVYVKEQREERQPVLRQERRTTQDSERTHDAPGRSNVEDARTRERDEDEARVRPRSVAPASDEDDTHVRPRGVARVPDEEGGLIRPNIQTTARAPFVTPATTRGEHAEASPREPREPAVREADEVKRPSNVVRPAPSPQPARHEAAATTRSAREEESSFTRNESARSRERESRGEDAAPSRLPIDARRARGSAGPIEPPPARRRERQAAEREASRERAEVAPTINVTIGRVEVRATQTPAPAQRRAETAAPRMSLDDYLRRRRNGEVRE